MVLVKVASLCDGNKGKRRQAANGSCSSRSTHMKTKDAKEHVSNVMKEIIRGL